MLNTFFSVFKHYNIPFVAADVNENDIKRAKLGGYAENWPGTLRLTGEAVRVHSLPSTRYALMSLSGGHQIVQERHCHPEKNFGRTPEFCS